MSYPLSVSDFPPLAELSVNDFHRPASRRASSDHSNSTCALTCPTFQIQGQGLLEHHLSSHRYPSQWSVPGWQSTLQFASDSSPPSHLNVGFEASSWDTSMPYHKFKMESLFLPRISLPELDLAPSPSNTTSSLLSDLSPSPPPSLHVVCDIPVVAPRPLPYHSPTFLQFDLPDVDEDLSRPPYTTKRKRKAADELDNPTHVKRHTTSPDRRSPRLLQSDLASHLATQSIEMRARRQRKR